MLAEERRRKLLDALKKNGALSVSAASDLLQVSRMTVHRDLDAMAAGGLLRKVHGGAVPVVGKLGLKETARPFTERKPANASAKERIAMHLANILKDANTIALDASTTVFALAFTLQNRNELPGVFVLSNGVPLFQELQKRNVGFRLALTGGEPHPRTGSLVGPLAIKSLEGLRFDYTVISAAGYMEDEGQVYDSTPEGAAVKQALLSRGNKKILALDRSKVNFLAPYPLGVITDFDMYITEEGEQEIPRAKKHHHHTVAS
jgi:DeoR/GlpR family transcriptional regulator of sugar metabolism